MWIPFTYRVWFAVTDRGSLIVVSAKTKALVNASFKHSGVVTLSSEIIVSVFCDDRLHMPVVFVDTITYSASVICKLESGLISHYPL
jgi:hypothetical protein